MEIMGEHTQRVLTYIEAANRQGCPLSVAQVDAYAQSWKPIETFTGLAGWRMAMAAQESGEDSVDTEKMSDYLLRLQWVSRAKDRVVVPTRLGLAMLREANSPRPDSGAESTLEVVMDPSNPFAYAQLMAKVTSLGSCLIVDPYLDEQQLLILAGFPNVTRILTGEKGITAKRSVFGLVLQAAPHLEIRTVKQGDLHDRFAIPLHGSVLMLGSSLNSIAKRFGVATTLEESTSRLIADNYDKIWERGTAITAQAPPASVAIPELDTVVTGATVDEKSGS